MKAGQLLTSWWQEYVLGRLRSPQDLVRASRLHQPDPARASERFFTEPVDGPRFEAPRRLQAPLFILTEPSLRQWDKADWQYVDERLLRWSAVFTELARKRGVPLYTQCAFRGEAEQDNAVLNGNSKTRYPRSAHNIGEAVDIVHGVYHWTLTKEEWSFLHVLGLRALDLVNAGLKKPEQLQLNWGGDDGSPSDRFRWDPAHWEITDYRSRVRRLPVGLPLRYTPRSVLARVKL